MKKSLKWFMALLLILSLVLFYSIIAASCQPEIASSIEDLAETENNDIGSSLEEADEEVEEEEEEDEAEIEEIIEEEIEDEA